MAVTTDGRASRAVLRVCLATGFVTLLDSAILTVAAPALRSELGATTAQLQWILAGYSLTFGLALVPAGRLGDRLGRGRPLAVGLALFAAGSLVGATASDADVLVAARLLQGVGAGTANPQVIGLLQDHYAGPARARALGAYASTGAFAMVLSPLVGGGILSGLGPAAGWRAAVGLAAPLGLAVAVVALRVLRRGSTRAGGLTPRGAPGRDGGAGEGRAAGRPAGEGLSASRARGGRVGGGFDAVGLVLVTLVTLGLLVPFVAEGPRAVVLPLSLGVLAAAVGALVVWEPRYARRGRTPVLAPVLLRSPTYVLGCVVAAFSFGAALGYSAVLMLFLQDGAGLSPVQAGLVTTPGAIASVVAANLSWRLFRRFGRRGVSVAVGAKALVAAGTALAVAVAPTATVVAVLVLSQVLTGVVGGLTISPNQTLTLEGAPGTERGVAGAALQLVQRVAATVCIAAMTGTFVGRTDGAVPGVLDAHRDGLVVVSAAVAALALVAWAASLLDGRLARPAAR
ncbi:MFS transporter [Cellulosimicrobium cellulans]|uniref:MFS transporter n=1 Tax=Cellulosimicrobium cellulans TaxID=1710 RepID=UPI002096BC37|nr:MFS transporter [Cellulosimicrobium cellulans]MCO7275367.1 MFS transporter [Cellulosimicrobium cellulans]